MKMVDVTKPAASSELGIVVVQAMGMHQKRKCPVCLFHNVYFQEFLDEYKLTHGHFLFDTVDLVCSDPLYNMRSKREDGNYHYYVLTIEHGGCSCSLKGAHETERSWLSVLFSVISRPVVQDVANGQRRRRTPTVRVIEALQLRRLRVEIRQFVRSMLFLYNTLKRCGTL